MDEVQARKPEVFEGDMHRARRSGRGRSSGIASRLDPPLIPPGNFIRALMASKAYFHAARIPLCPDLEVGRLFVVDSTRSIQFVSVHFRSFCVDNAWLRIIQGVASRP
jgi:hypothetical protein